jgi:hypothetical protein
MSALGVTGRVESFLDDKLKYRSMRTQMIAAFVAGILFAGFIGMGYVTVWGTDARSVYGGVFYVLMLLAVFVPVVIWVAGTLVTYIIARLLGARVEFGILMRSLGWGNVPLIGTSAALTVGAFLGLRGVPACGVGILTCDLTKVVPIETQVSHIFSLLGVGVDTTVFLAFYAVAVACFLLTGYVWYVGAYQSSTLTRAGSALTTGLSVVVGLGILTAVVF